MRILFIVPYFAPAWGYGGPPKVIHDMSRRLVRRGHDVTVYSTDALDGEKRIEKRFEELNGVKTYYFRNISNWLCWNQKIFLPLGFGDSIKRTIRQFDLVHLSDFRTYQNAVTYNHARNNGVPYVVSAFGQIPRGAGVRRPVKHVYDLLFGYDLLRGANKVIAQTENEARACQSFGVNGDRIALIPLGIDLAEFENLPSKGTFRRKYSISEDEAVILFLGRIHEYKGISLLIEAFARLSEIAPKVRLVVVGRDDGYFSTMANLIRTLGIEGKVVLTGPLYGEEKIRAYVDADIFVLTPSHYEETPMAGLEACACGTPVVVTKQASIPGLEEHQGGIVIDYDEGALTDAMLRILNSDSREKWGAKARSLVEEVFNWEKVIVQIERVYVEALHES